MPRRMAFAMIISFFAVALYSVRAQQDEKSAKNTDLVIAESHVLPGLPDAFALAYEFEPDSTSPDGRFGVIFPGTYSDFPNEEALGRDFVVSLKPFQVLAANEGVYYRGTNGMGVEWTRDNSAVLVTLGGRWGTIGATLFELRDGRVTRRTDLWAEMMKLVAAKFPQKERSNLITVSNYFRPTQPITGISAKTENKSALSWMEYRAERCTRLAMGGNVQGRLERAAGQMDRTQDYRQDLPKSRMKTRIATACMVMALTAADMFSQDETFFQPRRIVTAPSGKFHIESVKDGLAVVTGESNVEPPNLLPTPRDIADRESVPETPFAFVSPDGRWIFVVWRSGGYWPDTIAELYHVVDSSKLQFDFATKERFDQLAWKFLSHNESLDDSEIGNPRGAERKWGAKSGSPRGALMTRGCSSASVRQSAMRRTILSCESRALARGSAISHANRRV